MTEQPDEHPPLTVVELTASNVLRLTAVDITPDPDSNVVIIGGRNGQGKTSVLNAIFAALAGNTRTKSTMPDLIRYGEDRAEVRLDLGEYVVARQWTTDGKPTLTVTSADGVPPAGSAQRFLDQFLGALTFDPLAFLRDSPKDQVATLLPLVELPFDLPMVQAELRDLEARRTEFGRDRDRLVGHAGSLAPPNPATPDEEVSTEALLSELQAAYRARDDRGEAVLAADRARQLAVKADARLDEIDRLIERLNAERLTVIDNRDAALAEADGLDAKAASITVPDVAAIEERMAAADTINAAVRAKNAYEEAQIAARVADAEYDDFTLQIEERRGAIRRGVADAEMPLPGLGFDLDSQTVTYHDVPLVQCSAAEQLRVSMAIAMALNPTIRIMLIRDGSLLDDDSMSAVRRLAAEHHYQVWLERVGTGDAGAIIIEDGQVVT